jgi:hypothetical protein
VSAIYIGWIVAHYVAVHAYKYFCVPSTWVGFLLSPLTATSIQCIGLRWTIYTGGNTIITMWIIIGAWVIKSVKL